MKYKGYDITDNPNEWTYYEATSLTDCDAPILVAPTLDELKIEIDELN